MNWDRIEGNWKQFKGSAKQQWGKLTDDQLDVIAGRRDQLAGKIQEIYGIAQDEVESQLSHWQKQQKDIADSSKWTNNLIQQENHEKFKNQCDHACHGPYF